MLASLPRFISRAQLTLHAACSTVRGWVAVNDVACREPVLPHPGLGARALLYSARVTHSRVSSHTRKELTGNKLATAEEMEGQLTCGRRTLLKIGKLSSRTAPMTCFRRLVRPSSRMWRDVLRNTLTLRGTVVLQQRTWRMICVRVLANILK